MPKKRLYHYFSHPSEISDRKTGSWTVTHARTHARTHTHTHTQQRDQETDARHLCSCRTLHFCPSIPSSVPCSLSLVLPLPFRLFLFALLLVLLSLFVLHLLHLPSLSRSLLSALSAFAILPESHLFPITLLSPYFSFVPALPFNLKPELRLWHSSPLRRLTGFLLEPSRLPGFLFFDSFGLVQP